MVAGCATRLSTPPRDSASEKQRRLATNSRTASCPPASSSVTTAPKPRCWRRASSCPGWLTSPGYHTRGTFGCASSHSASAWALRPWCSRRACSVRRPRRVMKLSNGAPVSPRQFAHHASCSCSALVRATTAPPTTSLWPFRYLVVECTTRSAPKASGCCQPGDRKVLSTTTSAPQAWARALTAAMSVMRSSGLLGVSIHTSAAGCDRAAASAASSPKSTNSTCRSPRRRHASNRR